MLSSNSLRPVAACGEVSRLGAFLVARCGSLQASFHALTGISDDGAQSPVQLTLSAFDDGLKRLGCNADAETIFRAVDTENVGSISLRNFLVAFGSDDFGKPLRHSGHHSPLEQQPTPGHLGQTCILSPGGQFPDIGSTNGQGSPATLAVSAASPPKSFPEKASLPRPPSSFPDMQNAAEGLAALTEIEERSVQRLEQSFEGRFSKRIEEIVAAAVVREADRLQRQIDRLQEGHARTSAQNAIADARYEDFATLRKQVDCLDVQFGCALAEVKQHSASLTSMEERLKAVTSPTQPAMDPEVTEKFRVLDATLAHIQQDMGRMEAGLARIQEETGSMDTGLANVKQAVEKLRSLETAFAHVQQDVGRLETSVAHVEQNAGSMEKLRILESRLEHTQQDVGRIATSIAQVEQKAGSLETSVAHVEQSAGSTEKLRILESGLSHVQLDITRLDSALAAMEQSRGSMEGGLANAKQAIDKLRSNEGGLSDLRRDMGSMETSIAQVKQEITSQAGTVEELREELRAEERERTMMQLSLEKIALQGIRDSTRQATEQSDTERDVQINAVMELMKAHMEENRRNEQVREERLRQMELASEERLKALEISMGTIRHDVKADLNVRDGELDKMRDDIQTELKIRENIQNELKSRENIQNELRENIQNERQERTRDLEEFSDKLEQLYKQGVSTPAWPVQPERPAGLSCSDQGAATPMGPASFVVRVGSESQFGDEIQNAVAAKEECDETTLGIAAIRDEIKNLVAGMDEIRQDMKKDRDKDREGNKGSARQQDAWLQCGSGGLARPDSLSTASTEEHYAVRRPNAEAPKAWIDASVSANSTQVAAEVASITTAATPQVLNPARIQSPSVRQRSIDTSAGSWSRDDPLQNSMRFSQGYVKARATAERIERMTSNPYPQAQRGSAGSSVKMSAAADRVLSPCATPAAAVAVPQDGPAAPIASQPRALSPAHPRALSPGITLARLESDPCRGSPRPSVRGQSPLARASPLIAQQRQVPPQQQLEVVSAIQALRSEVACLTTERQHAFTSSMDGSAASPRAGVASNAVPAAPLPAHVVVRPGVQPGVAQRIGEYQANLINAQAQGRSFPMNGASGARDSLGARQWSP